MHGVIKRYRFMAVAAGIMSLMIWFIYMPTKYLLPEFFDERFVWIAIVHGYIYAFYVLAAIHFTARARFTIKRMILFILAGTLPIASFIAERRVMRQFPLS